LGPEERLRRGAAPATAAFSCAGRTVPPVILIAWIVTLLLILKVCLLILVLVIAVAQASERPVRRRVRAEALNGQRVQVRKDRLSDERGGQKRDRVQVEGRGDGSATRGCGSCCCGEGLQTDARQLRSTRTCACSRGITGSSCSG
jgi:hypothetical protein